MNTDIGYAVISQVFSRGLKSCGDANCGPWHFCDYPKRPACHAVCVHDPAQLEQHPDCQEWYRKATAWKAAHETENPTGGTRLGPLHYFQNCKLLLRLGPRRKDARVIAITGDTAQLLALPVCKECAARMAPLERQFTVERTTADAKDDNRVRPKRKNP